MKKALLIGGIGFGVVALLTVIFGFWAIATYTNVRNEGNKLELALTAKYSSIQADYGQWRLGVTDQLGIAREKSAAMDEILRNAIEGRYNKAGSPDVDSGKLFSAISEAYPDLTGLNIYDKIMEFVKQGREKFGQNQAEMQQLIQGYNTWRTTGSFLHPTFASWLFPSDNLKARVGDKVYTGEEALEKMSRVIVGGDTTQIFDSGEDKPVVER